MTDQKVNAIILGANTFTESSFYSAFAAEKQPTLLALATKETASKGSILISVGMFFSFTGNY
jgi:hypothetical protein